VTWVNITFTATASLFLLWAFSVLWHLRWVQRLPALSTIGSLPERHLRCSVVIAARDEAARIEQTIRHLLTQRSVELEVIVVDDRSSDGTGEILQRLAKEDARLKVKHVQVLPDGWLGKCHACHIGAGLATGDWILFTDADCWLKPDVLARAFAMATMHGADHVAMVSGLATSSLGLKASHLLFLISFANWFSGVNRDRPKSFMGFGAFNLVHAEAYRKCGGYQALRLTVVDDIKLGLLLRRAGKKTRAFLGGDDVECHWGTSACGMVKIMEKNYFAALDYRVAVVVAGSTFVLLILSTLILGLFSATWPGIAAALSPFAIVAPAAILARQLNWPLSAAFFVPFMLLMFLYTLLNSTFMTLRRGGIRWRETFYPLKALRAGNVQ
jgi:hypothetical protein